jgi:hypothetical protein
VAALSNEVLGDKINSTNPHEAVTRIQVLMGVVALINSPKIVDLENVPTDKINKHRMKKNKPPLVSHSIIKLQKHVKAQQKASVETGAGVALHWRRGHFKAKPKGMTWWNPHVVGKRELGEVVSGYLMETN